VKKNKENKIECLF